MIDFDKLEGTNRFIGTKIIDEYKALVLLEAPTVLWFPGRLDIFSVDWAIAD